MEFLNKFKSISRAMRFTRFRVILYCCYFLAAFLFFLYLKFPLEAVFDKYWKDHAAGLPIEIKTEKVRPALLCGLSLSDVVVTGKGKYDPFFPLEISRLTFKVSPFSLLGKDRKLAVKADLLNGSARVLYEADGPVAKYRGELDRLDLEKFAPLNAHEVKASGVLEGTYDLSIESSSVRKLSGSIGLKLKNGSLDNLKVSGISIPKVTFTNLDLDLNIDRGKVQIAKAVVDGSDITGEVTGEIVLRDNILNSVIRCDTKFTVSDQFKKDSILQTALALLPANDDGSYQIPIWGTLRRPRPQMVSPRRGRQ